MKNTNIQLLKFKCNNKQCQFEFYINRNNNILTHYNKDMSTMMEWKCPDCGEDLRYANINVEFNFYLNKQEKNGND